MQTSTRQQAMSARELRRAAKNSGQLVPSSEVISNSNDITQKPISRDQLRPPVSGSGAIATQRLANITEISSPIGDGQLVLDLSDFVLPQGNSHTSIDSIPPPAKPQNEEKELAVYVQHKGHYRRTTVKELQTQQQRQRDEKIIQQQSIQVDGSGGDNSNYSLEARISNMLKRTQLLTVAVSYFSYGLASGLALFTLVTFPWRPLSFNSVTTDKSTGDIRYISYTAIDLVRFLGFYSQYSQTISNIFSILTTIVFLHAIETRHSLSETKKRIGDTYGSHGSISKSESTLNSVNTTLVHLTLRRRTVIANMLLLLCGMAFFANTIMIYVDDRIGESRIFTGTGISSSPYYYAAADYKSQTIRSTIDWYWGALVGDDSVNVSPAFQSDQVLWIVMNCIRGLALIMAWITSLFEIKLRSAHFKRHS